MKSFEAAITILESLLSGEAAPAPGGTVPQSTRYRHIDALRRSGLVFRAGPDRYLPHPSLLERLEQYDRLAILSETVRPAMKDLALSLGCTAHFGVLESDMVTYLVKESAAPASIFTREMQQLEAYCSAIGKILLAHLGAGEIERYLATGPFPALTGQTRTDPADIRAALDEVRRDGYAIDAAEIDRNLFCLAVPAHDGLGRLVGAISVSSDLPAFIESDRQDGLSKLRRCAGRIAGLLT